MARFLMLRRLGQDVVAPWMEPGSLGQMEPARRLLATGANPHDVLLVARCRVRCDGSYGRDSRSGD